MILPVVLISACFLISVSLGSEDSCYLSEEQQDDCASVCYPIVKPLLRYFEKTNEKDAQLFKCRADYTELQKKDLEKYAQLSKCQQDYSDLVKSHLELKDSEVKYEKLLSKQQEVDNQKNKEIELLKAQISDLKKTSELTMLTNQLREDIAKLGKIVKIGGMDENNPTKSNNKTKNLEVETEEVPTTPLPNINNKTTSKTEMIDFPDFCPRKQDIFTFVYREIKLPGSDPYTVYCRSNSRGSGWLNVYRKFHDSKRFNRTYEDYERGFGDVRITGSEFFIGLNRLHLLTSGKPQDVLLWTGEKESRCSNFFVGDKSEGHKVKSIGNCTGDRWIIPKQGSKFSTFDRDLDGVPGRNLAEEWSSGWWFDSDMSGKSPESNDIYMYIRRTDWEK